MISNFDPSRLMTMTKEEAQAEAEKNKCAFRVVSEDGEHLMVTADARSDRINVELENNRVVAVRVG